MSRVSIQNAILLLTLSVFGGNAVALELFGVDIEKSQRDELRSAAKKAGVKLIQEGGKDQWFDSYDSSKVLPLSHRLYLGFVKLDNRFAFAEYELVGLNHAQLLRKLGQKYGSPEITNGKFISDRNYRWKLDGIEISLRIDWQNFRTRLSYIEPVAFAALRKERTAPGSEPSKVETPPDYSVY